MAGGALSGCARETPEPRVRENRVAWSWGWTAHENRACQEKPEGATSMEINRAPVLTLWAVVVAERLGYRGDSALTLGKALAGLNAQSKGRALGIYEAKDKERAEKEGPGLEVEFVQLMGRSIPATRGEKGYLALDKGKPMDPESVRRYLDKKFGDKLETVMDAMRELAGSYGRKELEQSAFGLYEEFRPQIPKGTQGWGAKGEMDIGRIKRLAK